MPDPEIIGNIEGNERLRDRDRASAREELDQVMGRRMSDVDSPSHEIIGQVVKGSEPVHGIRNAEAEDPPE